VSGRNDAAAPTKETHMFRHARTVTFAILTVAVLFVGLAGTATAAKLITGKHIKNNTVTTADVKNGTVKTGDLAASARTTLKFADGNDAQLATCADTALDACPNIIAVGVSAGSHLISATGTYANPVNAGVPDSINRCGIWRDGVAIAEARITLAGNGSPGESQTFSLQATVTTNIGNQPVSLRCTEMPGEALVITSPALSVLKVASIN
jgi:hypothetical protein